MAMKVKILQELCHVIMYKLVYMMLHYRGFFFNKQIPSIHVILAA